MAELIRTDTEGLGVYIHVPFCLSKCSYCDFYSLPAGKGGAEAHTRALIPAYLDAIENEARAVVEEHGRSGARVDTIFFGGGTPSMLTPLQVQRIMETIAEVLVITPGAEVSLEVNPETAAPCSFESFLKAGITRFSIGVQSFQPAELRTLGRAHGVSQAKAAIRQARLAGAGSVGIDLMYGIPGQDLSSWGRTLDEALSLGPDHISAYGLTLEAGTRLAARVAERYGSIAGYEEANEDLHTDMYGLLIEATHGAGLERYEVSNFARPGHECRHNLGYWRQGDYLGFGPGAHSHLKGNRWSTIADLDSYLGIISALKSVPSTALSSLRENLESLSEQDGRAEAIFLSLRMREGLDLAEYAARYGSRVQDDYPEPIGRLVAEGSLEVDGTRMRVPDERVTMLNAISSEFV